MFVILLVKFNKKKSTNYQHFLTALETYVLKLVLKFWLNIYEKYAFYYKKTSQTENFNVLSLA